MAAVSVNAGNAAGSGDCLHAFIPPKGMYQVALPSATITAYTGKGIAGARLYYKDEMLPVAYHADEETTRRVLAAGGLLRVVLACAPTQVSDQVTAAGDEVLNADQAAEPATALPKQALMVGSACILPLA